MRTPATKKDLLGRLKAEVILYVDTVVEKLRGGINEAMEANMKRSMGAVLVCSNVIDTHSDALKATLDLLIQQGVLKEEEVKEKIQSYRSARIKETQEYRAIKAKEKADAEAAQAPGQELPPVEEKKLAEAELVLAANTSDPASTGPVGEHPAEAVMFGG